MFTDFFRILRLYKKIYSRPRKMKIHIKQFVIGTLEVHFVEVNMFIMFQVVYCMDRCLEISPGCSRFKVLKAECLALLKRYDEAQIIAK